MWHNTQKILNPKGNHCKRNHLILWAIFVVFLCPISPSWLTRNIKAKCSKSVKRAMREAAQWEFNEIWIDRLRGTGTELCKTLGLLIENGIRNFIWNYQTNFLCKGCLCVVKLFVEFLQYYIIVHCRAIGTKWSGNWNEFSAKMLLRWGKYCATTLLCLLHIFGQTQSTKDSLVTAYLRNPLKLEIRKNASLCWLTSAVAFCSIKMVVIQNGVKF